MLTARVGVAVAAFVLVVGLGAVVGVRRAVQPVLDGLFPEKKLLVRGAALDVSLLRIPMGKIDDGALERIRALPGVERVDPQMPVQFPLHAFGRIPPMTEDIATEVVVIGVPRELVADGLSADETFEWTLDDARPVPVVLSRYFVDIYNLGLAESNQLPRLNENAIVGKTFSLVLGQSMFVVGGGGASGTPERERTIRCRVAGLSRDPNLTGLAVPLSAVRSFHRWYYGESYRDSYSLVQVRARSVGDLDPLATAIGKMGMIVQSTGATHERWSRVLGAATGVVGAFGFAVLFIALANVANTFALVLSERREEIGLLRTLGAQRRLVRGLCVAESAWVAGTGAAAGALAGWATAAFASRRLAAIIEGILPASGFSVAPDWTLVAAVIVGIAALSGVVAWPLALRIARQTPAALLRGQGA